MKRILLFISMLATLASHAQAPIDQTRESRILVNRALQARFALIIPGGSTPVFPSYVPDTLKTKALWMKPDGLYRYNGTAWVLIGADPDLSNYLMLTGATNQSIAGNVRATGTLRSETGGLYSQLNGSKIESGNSNSTDYAAGTGYNDVLTQTGTGNKIRFKNGTYEFYFDGNFLYRASDSKKALFEGDIPSFTASNGISLVGNDIQFGGTLSSGTTVYIDPYYFQLNAYSSTFTIDRNSIISGLLHNSGGGRVTASKLAMYGDYTEMYMEDNSTGGHSSLKLDNNGNIVFKDTYNNKGVVYDDNYRANFTALSLVDKGYADSVASAATSGYVPTTRTVSGFPLSGNITLASLTPGYGLSGSAYNGSIAQTRAVDTATAIVSKVNLANQMALKLSKSDTTSLARKTPQLYSWTNSASFSLTSITRDGNEAIVTATVIWPDGSTGTFNTDTTSSFPGSIDAYHITYVPASGPTKTITQALITRNGNGSVINQPALTITP